MPPLRTALASILALACWGATAARAGGPEGTRVALDGLDPHRVVGVWEGECRQIDLGSLRDYPMRLEVSSVKGDGPVLELAGELSWPSLRGSATRMQGTGQGNLLEFTETELLRGSNIILNGQYRATLRTPDRIEGIWTPPPGFPGVGFATFRLTRRGERPLPERWLGDPR